MNTRVSLITLGITDLARARRFYEDIGFEVSAASQGDVVFFRSRGIVLALHPWKLLAEDATVPPAGSGFRGVVLAYNVREKVDVSTMLELARRAGASIVKPAQDVFWGGHSGYFADPDGHLWEVAYNPFFKFDESGELAI